MKVYFTDDLLENELIQVVVSSKGYDRRQVSLIDQIQWLDDKKGDELFLKELAVYNKVDYIGEAIIQIELHPYSVDIAKVRFQRSSGVGEIDRLVSEDITRWQLNLTEGSTLYTEVTPEEKKNAKKKRKTGLQYLVRYIVILKSEINYKDAVDYLKGQQNVAK